MQLASFLGLANFVGICQPLYELKKKEEFSWNGSSEKNFNSIKERLISAPVLQPFSLLKYAVLEASEKSIGAVLSQDGRPNLFLSRMLSQTESRYSNIE